MLGGFCLVASAWWFLLGGFRLQPPAENLLERGVRDHSVILAVINGHLSILHLSNVSRRHRGFMRQQFASARRPFPFLTRSHPNPSLD